MANMLLRWLVPGIVTIAAGTALAVSATEGAISTDLNTRAAAALGGEAEWAHLEFEGNHAILTGIASNQGELAQVIARVSALPGIASLDQRATVVETASPYPFSASLDNGVLTLTGGYPNEDVHKTLVAEAGAATDSLRHLGGAGDLQAFSAAAAFGLDVVKDLDQGRVQFSDLALTIEGRARSPQTYDELLDLADHLPAGVTLASVEITPPLASPYSWSANFDGTHLYIQGDTPGGSFADQLRSAVPSTIPASLTLTPASGSPEGYSDKALQLLADLLSLQSGDASIRGDQISLSGVPASAAEADDITARVAALGGTAQLAAPAAPLYTLTIDKSGSSLVFDGVVPDKATRLKLAALAGADVSAVTLNHAAPAHFGDGVQFGLDALSHLAAGRVDLRGTDIGIGGTAATVADYTALDAMLAQGPAGFEVTAGTLRPPRAERYTWTASKASDGSVSLSGYVPDETTRNLLEARISSLSKDLMEPADGAPAGFAQSAAKGLEVLALLDSGKVSYDGTTWSITGAVDSIRKAFAADAAYSIAGLRTAGWNYDLEQPSLPTVSPFVWQARKSADGVVALTGYAPDDGFQQLVKLRVPHVNDQTSLAAGAPAGFGAAALAGLDALNSAEAGTLGFSGSTWTLDGTVSNSSVRDALQSKLAAAADTADWSVKLVAEDQAPVVAPYLWSATKTPDGNIAIAGYVPSESVRADALAHAAKADDTTTIAAGAPAGFADDVSAGLDALAHLTTGRAMFDGGKWTLTGSVASQADGEAAVAALANASQGGHLWGVLLSGYTPPASSSAEPPASAAEPSPSTAPASGSEASPSTASSADVAASDIVSIAPLIASSEPMQVSSSAAAVSSSSAAAASSEPAAASSESSEAAAAPAASSEIMPSSASAVSSASSSMEAPAPVSSSAVTEPSASSSVASISSEPASVSEPPSASEPPPSSSSEAPSSSSMEPVTPASESAPMPTTLTFEATLEPGGSLSLKGSVPAAADIKAIGKATGASTKNLTAASGLPDGFTASATAGIAAIGKLGQGHLGFDGSTWWLRADAYNQASRDAAAKVIAAVPGGSAWNVGITVLAPLDACRTQAAAIAKANIIQFTGRATLTKPAIAAIDALATTLKACPATNIHVQGHTDSDGGAQANLVVSVARAEAVIAQFVKDGLDDGRFYAEGYGETDPIASNDTKAGKAANRRISFEIDPQ